MGKVQNPGDSEVLYAIVRTFYTIILRQLRIKINIMQASVFRYVHASHCSREPEH
jgi:hypothetical protein